MCYFLQLSIYLIFSSIYISINITAFHIRVVLSVASYANNTINLKFKTSMPDKMLLISLIKLSKSRMISKEYETSQVSGQRWVDDAYLSNESTNQYIVIWKCCSVYSFVSTCSYVSMTIASKKCSEYQIGRLLGHIEHYKYWHKMILKKVKLIMLTNVYRDDPKFDMM